MCSTFKYIYIYKASQTINHFARCIVYCIKHQLDIRSNRSFLGKNGTELRTKTCNTALFLYDKTALSYNIRVDTWNFEIFMATISTFPGCAWALLYVNPFMKTDESFRLELGTLSVVEMLVWCVRYMLEWYMYVV